MKYKIFKMSEITLAKTINILTSLELFLLKTKSKHLERKINGLIDSCCHLVLLRGK